MAEKKKKQTAEFAKDKNAFASGVPAKKNSVENKDKQKQSGAHQPRDADTTSGHNVQKFKQPESANGSVKQNVSKQKDRQGFRTDLTSSQVRAVDKPLAKKICIYENICVDESLR